MTSLADELMNDLDSDSEGEDDPLDAVLGLNGHARPSTSTSKLNGTTNEASNGVVNDDDGQEDEAGDVLMESTAVGDMVVPEGGVRPTLELNPDDVNAMQLGEVGELAKVAKLANGKTMKDVLSKIAYYREHPDPNLASDGDSQEYRLIVQANNLNVEIDNEMLIVHKFIKDHYLPRFPELDTLVSAPLPFCRVILALGNGPELRGDLTGLLTSGTVMAVTVTAATSRGQTLDDAEWKVVEGACAMMFQLDDAKRTILEYVESRISLLAPNISAIVGTQTATKVLGIAGGLQGLSRIPHSNIYVCFVLCSSLIWCDVQLIFSNPTHCPQVLGAVKRATTGFSTAAHSVDRLHTGFIYQCPLVQRTRAEDRMKAQRKVGAKVALACRVDLAGSHPTGQFGEEMLEKLEKEMERLARPAPSKIVKALPRPDEQKKARRGGKRARKAKEAYAQTALRKQQNRMKFGEAEEETGYADETVGMGMIGSSGSGRVRVTDGEARSKAKLSKSAKGRLASIKTSSSATSGLATSLAFTPVQGLELVDPSKLRTKTEEANANWFANDGAFTHVQKGGGFGKSQVKR